MKLIRIETNSNINPIAIDDINKNFETLQQIAEVGDNNELLKMITTLEADINGLQSKVTTLQTNYTSLNNKYDALAARVAVLEKPV